MAAQMYNWTGSQWSQGLEPLWTQESGFNNNAQNPTSTAYGIAQFLNSTWGPYGPKTSNAGPHPARFWHVPLSGGWWQRAARSLHCLRKRQTGPDASTAGEDKTPVRSGVILLTC
jgi:hypothetical protein